MWCFELRQSSSVSWLLAALFVPGRESSMCVVLRLCRVFWSVVSKVSVEGEASIVSVECDGFCRHVARKSPVVSPAIYRELPSLALCILSYPGTFF